MILSDLELQTQVSKHILPKRFGVRWSVFFPWSTDFSGSCTRWQVAYNHPIGSIYCLYTRYILLSWVFLKCLPAITRTRINPQLDFCHKLILSLSLSHHGFAKAKGLLEKLGVLTICALLLSQANSHEFARGKNGWKMTRDIRDEKWKSYLVP